MNTDILFKLTIIIATALLSWLFLYLLIPLLRNNFIDRPTERSSHSFPKARGGGIIFVFISLIGSLILFIFFDLNNFFILPLICLPLALIGLIDDKYNIPSLIRYIAQFTTVSYLVLKVSLINQIIFQNNNTNFLHLLLLLFVIIACTAIINFINFMDGIDGLVASCMLIILATASSNYNPSLLTLVGSLIGFLFLNWSPSKVFMGDVGSIFLGSILSGIILSSSNLSEGLGILLVSTPLLFDPFITLIKRFLSGQKIFQAHRLHLYQRLHQSGWSHGKVSSIFSISTAFLAISYIFYGLPLLFVSTSIYIIFYIWLDIKFAIPFSIASKK